MPFQSPTPVPDPLGGKGPKLEPYVNWCDAHKTLCGVKDFFSGNKGCGKGKPGPQDPIWPWGWVYRNTDWTRDRAWCEGGKNCDSPRREMSRWMTRTYSKVFGAELTSKLTDQDIRDMVVHYGQIGKRIYPTNLPCGETKWGQLADSIRKAAISGLEADLRSGAFVLGKNNSPADHNGGDLPNPPSSGTGNLPSLVTGAGFSGWVAVGGIALLLLFVARGGFK